MVVDGTPRLGFGLSDSGTNRHADYLRGSNTRTLVFAYTVEGADPSDADGIRVGDNALELNGGTILSVYGAPALLALTGFADDSAHPVDTSPGASVPTGGICDRTPLIRDRLLAVVRASEGDDTLTCADVSTAHLAALAGRLEIHGGSNGNLGGAYLTGLRAGDFNGLTGITELSLNVHQLREVPPGVFDPLTGLEGLVLEHNRIAGTGLTGLPPGLFDHLPGLKSLGLRANGLDALPARIFEPLRKLETLELAGNPGTARFVPTARAGEDLEVVSGGTVRLGVEGAELGYEDPWGDNVRWTWSVDEGEGGTLSSWETARASFTALATGREAVHILRLRVQRVGQEGLATEPDFASDTVKVRVLAGPYIESAAFIGLPGGRIHALPIYAGGEWIEVALRFNREVRVDTGAGVPSASLDVGGGMRTAVYRRGSGTRSLVFGYRVRSGDDDRDGVMLRGESLALNGAAIVGVSDGGSAELRHLGLEGGAGRGVLGRLDVPGTGVCGRSPAVAAAIVARVREENESVASCADVLLADLQGLAGTLDVSAQIAAHGRMTALESGDFADLGALTGLDLDDHALGVIPAGVFDPLISLTSLSISYNQTERGGLRTLPAGLFDRLTSLTTLRLRQNALETLPARIFEKLTKLETLTLDGNPGGARLLPDVVAGPAGGLGAKAGETVTLGGARAADPWGSNATYAWRQTRGTTVDLSAEDVASPTFTAPYVAEDETLVFELSRTGAGGSPGTANAHTATGTVEVAVEKAATITALAVTSEPVDGGDAYHAGESASVLARTATPSVSRSPFAILCSKRWARPGNWPAFHAASRVAVPIASSIVGAPLTVTDSEKMTSTPMTSPVAYVPAAPAKATACTCGPRGVSFCTRRPTKSLARFPRASRTRLPGVALSGKYDSVTDSPCPAGESRVMVIVRPLARAPEPRAVSMERRAPSAPRTATYTAPLPVAEAGLVVSRSSPKVSVSMDPLTVAPVGSRSARTASMTRTRTRTSSVLVWSPISAPRPRTVSRKVWSPVSSGAVNVARAVWFPASVPPVPETRVQDRMTLLPQGSSKPLPAPSTPSVTASLRRISRSSPALAMGANRTLWVLLSSERLSRPTSFSNVRGGSPARRFSERSSVATPVRASNTPGATVRKPALRMVTVWTLVPRPSNTFAGSAVSAFSLRSSSVMPARSAKSPSRSAVMVRLARSSLPVSAWSPARVTSAQVSASFASAIRTRASSSLRTWGVRAHTPPMRLAVPPSTLCAPSAASAGWVIAASVRAASVMLPPSSASAFAATEIPSLSRSAESTP